MIRCHAISSNLPQPKTNSSNFAGRLPSLPSKLGQRFVINLQLWAIKSLVHLLPSWDDAFATSGDFETLRIRVSVLQVYLPNCDQFGDHLLHSLSLYVIAAQSHTYDANYAFSRDCFGGTNFGVCLSSCLCMHGFTQFYPEEADH